MQLDETFSVVLSSHSTPPSRLGEHREVNITIRKNDDPFGVIEFIQSGLTATIKESKGHDTHSGIQMIRILFRQVDRIAANNCVCLRVRSSVIIKHFD